MLSEAVHRYVDLACRHHRGLQVAPRGDTDDLQSELGAAVGALDEDERDLAASLRQALARLRGPLDPASATNDEAIARAISAIADGTPHDQLCALEAIAPTIPIDAFAVRVAEVCARIGSPRAAHEFYRFAHERSPSDVYVALRALQTRHDSDAAAAAHDAFDLLRADSPDGIDTRCLERTHAGTALLLLAIVCEATASDAVAASFVPAVERAHARLHPVETRELGSLPWRLAGYCYDCAGDGALAAQRYVQAIARFPNELDLYERAGTLLFMVDSTRGPAATLLSRAIDLGTRSVWPRYFLAHELLSSDDFSGALEHLNAARRSAPDDASLQSSLYEWSAICLARSGYPADTVETLFDRAAELAADAGWQPQHLIDNRAAFDARGDQRPLWRVELCETARTHQVSAAPFRVSGSARASGGGSAVASAAAR